MINPGGQLVALVRVRITKHGEIHLPQTGLRFVEASRAVNRLQNHANEEQWTLSELTEKAMDARKGHWESFEAVRENAMQACLVIGEPTDIRAPDIRFGDLVLCGIVGVEEWRGLHRASPCNPDSEMVTLLDTQGTKRLDIRRSENVFFVPASKIPLVIADAEDLTDAA